MIRTVCFHRHHCRRLSDMSDHHGQLGSCHVRQHSEQCPSQCSYSGFGLFYCADSAFAGLEPVRRRHVRQGAEYCGIRADRFAAVSGHHGNDQAGHRSGRGTAGGALLEARRCVLPAGTGILSVHWRRVHCPHFHTGQKSPEESAAGHGHQSAGNSADADFHGRWL